MDAKRPNRHTRFERCRLVATSPHLAFGWTYAGNVVVNMPEKKRTLPMRLAVCILHYGKSDLTAKLHHQFLASDPDKSIFVLDNASPEPYPKAWKRLDENLFWAGALNFALGAFDREGYTHLWFCNNDMLFVSEPPYCTRALARMERLEQQSRVGLYSPSVTQNPYHRHMTAVPGATCRKAAYVDGIAPIINLACVKDIGGLDYEDNPLGYGVDVWLSLRASRQGWGVWVDHALVVRHKYHTAAGEKAGFLSRPAEVENAYMIERLGQNWRKVLLELQTTF